MERSVLVARICRKKTEKVKNIIGKIKFPKDRSLYHSRLSAAITFWSFPFSLSFLLSSIFFFFSVKRMEVTVADN